MHKIFENNTYQEHYALILGPDHWRLLAVWPVVAAARDTSPEGVVADPDLERWGHLADVHQRRVQQLWPVLRDLGCVREDGTIAEELEPILLMRVSALLDGDPVEDKPRKQRG